MGVRNYPPVGGAFFCVSVCLFVFKSVMFDHPRTLKFSVSEVVLEAFTMWNHLLGALKMKKWKTFHLDCYL